MFLNKVLHIRSMVHKSHLALSLFSCVLASVSYLKREKIFSEISFCVLSFHLCFIFSMSLNRLVFLWLCTVFSLFCCKTSRCYYLPLPDSRLCSIVLISVHTARWSTIIIIINGRFHMLWSNSCFNSSDFNDTIIFIWYHLFYYNVSILTEFLRLFIHSLSFMSVCLFFSIFMWIVLNESVD
jgi:hypothetical protein